MKALSAEKFNRKKGFTLGFTLIEIVISFAVLALISAPLLRFFAVSARNSVLSENITAATYICQSQMERLISKDYISLLEESSGFYEEDTGGLIMLPGDNPDYANLAYTVQITPAGVHENIFGNSLPSQYAHFIFYSMPESAQTSLIVLSPDGRHANFDSTGVEFNLFPIESNPLYNNCISWQSGEISYYFKTDPEKNLICISNFSLLGETAPGTIVKISSYTQDKFPGLVYYASDENIRVKFPVVPAPPEGRMQYFETGDIYDKMLVTIEIKAYFVQGGRAPVQLADIKDTVSVNLMIP
jgi:type II secretory pathway pseudopilin PulG